MNITNSVRWFSICIFNDSSVLVGGFEIIYRFDFNETHIWNHSLVYSLPGEVITGITLHSYNKSEGFISHNQERRFHHFAFNGTLVISSGLNFQLQIQSNSMDIKFNHKGNRMLASYGDGSIYLL